MSGVTTLPSPGLLGHVRPMQADPLGFFSRMRDTGSVVKLRMGPFTPLLVHDPAWIRHLLITRADNWRKDTPGYRRLQTLLGIGLVTAEDEVWKRQRRIVNPAFRTSSLAAITVTMNDLARRFASDWRSRPGTRPVSDDLDGLSLLIAGETLFGHDLGEQTETVRTSFREALVQFERLSTRSIPILPEYWPTPNNARYWLALRRLDRTVDAVVASRAGQPPRPDLLGMLLSAAEAEAEPLTPVEVRDQVRTLLLAGHETTAVTLGWTLDLLARHPHVLAGVIDEVDGTEDLTWASLSQQPLLSRVIKEALRLYPAFHILGRKALEADEIEGVPVPRGTMVFTSTYAMHRHPTYWADPDAFRPERWEGDGPGVPAGVYIPFSMGRRRCLGDRFAELELHVVLTHLLRAVRIAPVGTPPPAKVRITLRPARPVQLEVTPR